MCPTSPSDEVQTLPAGDSEPADDKGRMPNMAFIPPVAEVAKAIELMKNAKKPVIIIGHGAKHASKEVLALAEKLNAPIMTTFKAKGAVSDFHELACGVLGKSGTPVSAHFMSADLLLVFGASFARHTGISENISTIQVDFDPLSLAKFHSISVRVLGEIGESAKLFIEKLDDTTFEYDPKNLIAQKWKNWRATKSVRAISEKITNAKVFLELNKTAPEKGVMCVDVGNNAYSFGQYFESRDHQFLLSGYLGSIGFALPASIGAWAATKGTTPILAVAGDGGFGQYMAELTTLVETH